MSSARVPRIAWTLSIFFTFLLAAPARAEDAPPTAAPAAAVEVARPPAVIPVPATTVKGPRRVHPMIVEMRALMETERAQLKDLQARFRAASDATAALAVQLEIERLKAGTEIALLRVQASYARRAGRAAQADALEKVIAELETPPATRTGPAPASR